MKLSVLLAIGLGSSAPLVTGTEPPEAHRSETHTADEKEIAVIRPTAHMTSIVQYPEFARILTRIDGALGWGIVPGLTAGSGATLGLAMAPWRLELLVRRWSPQTTTRGASSIGAGTVGLGGCFVPNLAVAPVQLPICVQAHAGAVTARTRDGLAGVVSRAAWIGVGLRAGVNLDLLDLGYRRVALVFGLGASAALLRPAPMPEAGVQPVRPAPVTVDATVGVEVHFTLRRVYEIREMMRYEVRTPE